MTRRTPTRVGVVFAAGALVLAACGSDDDAAEPSDALDEASDVLDDDGGTDETTAMDEMDAMDGMDHSAMDMNMGDPDATPADAVAGAALARGEYQLLDTRPAGYDELAGTAVIARHAGGTTVTTEVTGLLPNVDYISHVHAQACDDESGGPHYQFEVGGSEFPPNEIHLAFTSDDDGNGVMTAENAQIAGLDAVAFVIHPAEFIDNKVACVDFVEDEPGAAAAALDAGLDPDAMAAMDESMDDMDHSEMDHGDDADHSEMEGMDHDGDAGSEMDGMDQGDDAVADPDGSGEATGIVSITDLDLDSIHAMDDELYDGEMRVDEHLAITVAAIELIDAAGAADEHAELLGYLTDLRAALEAGDVQAASDAAQWVHKIAHDVAHHS